MAGTGVRRGKQDKGNFCSDPKNARIRILSLESFTEFAADFRSRSVAAAGNSLSLASPRESKQREGDPGACVPSLRCGQPAVLSPAGVPLELAEFHSAQTIACPDPSGLPLLGAFTRVLGSGA